MIDARLALSAIFLVSFIGCRSPDSDIQNRLSKIIIPSVEFRDANGIDVIAFLMDGATSKTPREQASIGLVYTNQITPTEQFTLTIEDGSELVLKPLNLEYRDIPMMDLIDIVAKELVLNYSVTPDGIQFVTKDGKRIVRQIRVEQGSEGTSSRGRADAPHR